ncbi:hypothetical protein [Lysinibacillus fusiformis]|uniref:hypothetical protein n=1 Tax=Lysinibacillus fusiformis TaxID=28031 RepID=UPI001E445FEA|nr:hypothetical protein [Lysinibacillus fusiformis]
MSAKYRKKSNEVEAFKFYVDAFPDWFTNAVTENKVILHDCNYKKSFKVPRCEIKTLEGNMVAHEGDYIIKDLNGELRPCKPDIFEAIYEEAGKLNLSTTIDIDLVVDKFFKKLEEKTRELQNPSQITINGSLSEVDMEELKSCGALTIKKP